MAFRSAVSGEGIRNPCALGLVEYGLFSVDRKGRFNGGARFWSTLDKAVGLGLEHLRPCCGHLASTNAKNRRDSTFHVTPAATPVNVTLRDMQKTLELMS
jgi:hypothetical protein